MNDSWYVVGIDCGGTKNAGTVLGPDGDFRIHRLLESPSRVHEGTEIAIAALETAMDAALAEAGIEREDVRAVGLDTPGPVSATGVISRRGSTNFNAPEWRGFDVRTAFEEQIGIPVVYTKLDGNAAALYAHYAHFGVRSPLFSSVSAIVGTGLGAGLVEAGAVIPGRSGMAGELGHVQIPYADILEQGQPVPRCNCGQYADVESFASLTGIQNNLLPYWLTRYPAHPLHEIERPVYPARAYEVRSLRTAGRRAVPGDPRAAGPRARRSLPHRVELHGSHRLLRRWRHRRDDRGIPLLVPRPGEGVDAPPGGAGRGRGRGDRP